MLEFLKGRALVGLHDAAQWDPLPPDCDPQLGKAEIERWDFANSRQERCLNAGLNVIFGS